MTENKIIASNGSSIVLYTADDGNIHLEVKLENDSVWLNREQIAQLYGRDYKTIAKHINNALKEELEGEPVVAKFAIPKKYGRKEGYAQMQKIDYYNFDMIISVGYRVKSRNGIAFRKWANSILKQYLIRGYAIDQRRLDHYDELKDVVRLMSRAFTLQDKVSEGEYSGLFSVIADYVYALDTLGRYACIFQHRLNKRNILIAIDFFQALSCCSPNPITKALFVCACNCTGKESNRRKYIMILIFIRI